MALPPNFCARAWTRRWSFIALARHLRLGHTACIFTLRPDVRSRTVRFEKTIEAKRNDYAIYQVQVTAHGFEKTEIGDIAWTFSQPMTMYTLRAAAPPLSASH